MKRTLIIGLVILMSAVSSRAQENANAEKAFCAYTAEQAKAQRDVLRSPSAVVGPTQPNTGTPPQMVFGVSNSLANDRKAGLTMKVARTTCDLYTATAEAQEHLVFALPAIQQDVLRHRLELIDRAQTKLDGLIAEDAKLVEAQNLTKPAVYHLQSARVRLDISRTETLTGITSPFVPELSKVPLRDLVGNKLQAEESNQRAQDHLAKQNSWDVQIAGGVRRQIYDGNSIHAPVGGFGEATLTYNFGKKAADSHLDRSLSSYMEWKNTQFDDVSRQAAILKKQIEETIQIQSEQLRALVAHNLEIQETLDSIKEADTSAALTFRNQMIADQIILEVDIADVQFRLARLNQYLADNF